MPWSTALLNTFWSRFSYGLGKWRDDSLLLLNSQAQTTKVPVSFWGWLSQFSKSPSLYLCANVLFPLTWKLHQNCYLAKVTLLSWKSRCFSNSLTIIHLSCVISEPSPHLFSILLNFLILIHQAILLSDQTFLSKFHSLKTRWKLLIAQFFFWKIIVMHLMFLSCKFSMILRLFILHVWLSF